MIVVEQTEETGLCAVGDREYHQSSCQRKRLHFNSPTIVLAEWIRGLTVNAHAAFRNLDESQIRTWVTPLMFSD